MEAPQPHILVVDDEPPICMTLGILLAELGYRVTTVGSGKEAMGLLGRQPFDLLLLDLKLPDISGLEVADHARGLQPAPAILIFTGFLPDDTDPLWLDSFEHLFKTASPEEVLERIITRVDERSRLN